MRCLPKNRIWKDEANQYTTIDDFQNVFPEGWMVLPAFVPAQSPKRLVEWRSDQGTLFLDEVGDIPIQIQPKLLRALTALDPPHEICEWNAEQPVLETTYRVGARSVVVLIAGEGRMPGISTGVQSAPAGSPRNGRTVLSPDDSIAPSLDIVRHP